MNTVPVACGTRSNSLTNTPLERLLAANAVTPKGFSIRAQDALQQPDRDAVGAAPGRECGNANASVYVGRRPEHEPEGKYIRILAAVYLSAIALRLPVISFQRKRTRERHRQLRTKLQ
jgi:hypothetical protein